MSTVMFLMRIWNKHKLLKSITINLNITLDGYISFVTLCMIKCSTLAHKNLQGFLVFFSKDANVFLLKSSIPAGGIPPLIRHEVLGPLQGSYNPLTIPLCP